MDYSILPVGKTQKALNYPHFPTRFQTVIWRNWGSVSFEKLAQVLHTTPENIRKSGMDLGLEVADFDFAVWAKRGYLTIIRHNWQLLNYEQLCELLDFTPEHLAFVLREDDFLWHKLGNFKPECEPIFYRELTPKEAQHTAKIKAQIAPYSKILSQREQPFAFLQKFGKNLPESPIKSDGLHLVYSYSALYGDPLLDESIDPFPENLLAEYAANGVNAVWLQGILYTLVPWLGEELGKNWQIRQQSLRNLTAKAAKYGIKIYLYLNEPRCIPVRYFAGHPDWMGTINHDGNAAFCPENQQMLDALSRALQTLCENVPQIGGFFTITQSENLTHCLARGRAVEKLCPVCAQKPNPADNIIKVLAALYKGIKNSGTSAKLTAWNWAWQPDFDAEILKQLPPEIKIQCVSETDLETDCCGIKGKVIDYSISKVGPGPTAQRLWTLAKENNHEIVAKVQVNCCWENSSIPYLPVPQLIRQHIENLQKFGIKDFMLSWTLGGYPGGNLDLLNYTVEEFSSRRFGKCAGKVIDAYQHFSDGFKLFPFNSVDLLYCGPQLLGPANLIYEKPTGFSATMTAFPYDDINSWRGIYPAEILEKTFKAMSEEIGKGWEILKSLKPEIELKHQAAYQDLSSIAEAFYLIVRSSYLQMAFINLRNAGKFNQTGAIVAEELELAERFLKLSAADSRIGFEATGHYLYQSCDILEKIVNCNYLADRIKTLEK